MRISKIIINGKKFDFKQEDTLIYSDKNSVGKTTLIRLLLYSLGYNVPSTKGLRFKDLETYIELRKNNEYIQIERKDNNLRTNLSHDELFHTDIYDDMLRLHSMVFGINIPEILNNILGIFYFDQEKGWTLLNRGVVIGSIRFSIEELIEGLDKKKLDRLSNRLEKLEQERKIYSQLNKLIALQEEYKGTNFKDDPTTLNLKNEHRTLKLELSKLNKDISDYVKIKKDNEELVKFIEQSGITILVKGEKVPVTRENIYRYEANQQLLNAMLARKRNIKKEYKKRLYDVEDQLNKKLRLISIEDQLAKFSNFLSNSDFSTQTILPLIERQTQEIKQLRQTIRKELYHSKTTLNIYNRVKEYSKILGIEDSIDDKKDFIFTSDLKRYSGAKLHLLVFAFRMAILKEVQQRLETKFPIILDSPKTGELDQNNFMLMFKLLNREFKSNQIIVASMTSPNDFSKVYQWNNLIKLHNRIFE